MVSWKFGGVSVLFGLLLAAGVSSVVSLAGGERRTAPTPAFEIARKGSLVQLPSTDHFGRKIEGMVARRLLFMPACGSCAQRTLDLRGELGKATTPYVIVWDWNASREIPVDPKIRHRHRFVLDTAKKVGEPSMRMFAPTVVLLDAHRRVVRAVGRPASLERIE